MFLEEKHIRTRILNDDFVLTITLPDDTSKESSDAICRRIDDLNTEEDSLGLGNEN